MRNVMILGATSAIAEATARLFARDKCRLFLAARNAERLSEVKADLEVRGAERVETSVADFDEWARHAALVEEADRSLGGLDAVLIAHGTLPDQKACESSFEAAWSAFRTNAVSTLSLATCVANYFEARGAGTLAVISSVAGDRGRQSNYVYGAAKAAVTAFLAGLRNRLHGSGVRVVTIKPGPVDTPMTRHMRRGLTWAEPAHVARAVHRAMRRGRAVVYVPWFWRWIMLILRLIPEPIFKRLRL